MVSLMGSSCPVLYGLKALMQIEDGGLKWQTDPVAFLDRHMKTLVGAFKMPMEMAGFDPQKIAKSENSYLFMVGEVEKALRRSKSPRLPINGGGHEISGLLQAESASRMMMPLSRKECCSVAIVSTILRRGLASTGRIAEIAMGQRFREVTARGSESTSTAWAVSIQSRHSCIAACSPKGTHCPRRSRALHPGSLTQRPGRTPSPRSADYALSSA